MPVNYKANSVDFDNLFILRSNTTLTIPVDQQTSPLYSTGYNNNGQLGLGDATDRNKFTSVGLFNNWKEISGSSYAVKTDGTLWAWGKLPTRYGTESNWSKVFFNGSAAAIKTNGTLWTWGSNTNGELGLGDTTFRSSPVQVGALTNWRDISGGSLFFTAIKTDGTLWSWGDNTYGQLGIGASTRRSSPIQIGALTNWKQVSASDTSVIAVKTDGTLWAWGRNDAGQLGLGNDLNHRSSPTQIGTLTNWSQVSNAQVGTSYLVLATKTDGTLWVWGRYDTLFGQLGLGSDYAHRSSPTQIGALTNWSQVSAGVNHCLAIKTDGTLWAWGGNTYGQLGLGSLFGAIHRSSPVQVGALTTWTKVYSTNSLHSYAIRQTDYLTFDG